MFIALPIFVALAARCAPTVHVDTLAAVAQVESGLDPLTIGDNKSRRSYAPADTVSAAALASRLIAQGHSLDLGLMQINSRNLDWLGLSVEQAFDPCRSLAAGARVLSAGYRPPPASAASRPALLQAISRYNTGDPRRGLANGYVTRVRTAAQTIVPSIYAAGDPISGIAETGAPVDPAPPEWDVYRVARYRALHGASLPALDTTRSAPVRLDVVDPGAVTLEPGQ